MKKFNLIVLLLITMSTYAQQFQWAKRGGLWAYDYGEGISTDPYGNVYIAGKYEENAIFSGVTLPCQGNHDIYTAKYDPYGNLLWIRTGGGPSGDYAHAVCTNSTNVYISGEIEGSNTTIKFPGSSITLTAWGNNDVMCAKYDLNGNLIWAKRDGGYNNEKAQGVAVDPNGNLYVCGYYENTTDFGNNWFGCAGAQDAFLVKYDANGNFQWVRHMGGPGRDEGKGLKCDAAGNVYMCGMYKNGCNFMGQYLSAPNGYVNAYLAKIDPYGNLKWVRTGGGNWDDVGWALTIDNYGKIFMTGEFNADANFSGQHVYTSGSADVFVACYLSDGTLSWVKKGGGTQVDRARGIGTDGNNIYVTGQFGGTAYFGSSYRTAVDGSDIFMACMNNSGTWMWMNAAGGPADDPTETLGFESGIAICAQANGNVYATGAMLNGASFGGTYLSPYSRTDVYITKLRNGVAAREAEESPFATTDVMLDGKALDNEVALSWNYPVGDAKDIALDKSTDGEHFTELKYFQADEVKGSTMKYNDITDRKIDKAQYRVRVIDVDGVTSFSKALAITPSENGGSGINVFPNPARTELGINIKTASDKKVKVLIYDASGRQVWAGEVENGCCKVDVSPWSRGVYVVLIKNDEAVLSRQKILVE